MNDIVNNIAAAALVYACAMAAFALLVSFFTGDR
jgi:hypothetical protein